jgi:hypothetical protein
VAAPRCSSSCLLCCARHFAHRAFWAVALGGSGKNRGELCRLLANNRSFTAIPSQPI